MAVSADTACRARRDPPVRVRDAGFGGSRATLVEDVALARLPPPRMSLFPKPAGRPCGRPAVLPFPARRARTRPARAFPHSRSLR